MAITLHPSIFVHVGIWLRKEIIEPHGLTVAASDERFAQREARYISAPCGSF
jgi:hypothetical protein